MERDLTGTIDGKDEWRFTPLGRSGRSQSLYRVRVGTVVGATDGWWSQVHHFCPTEEEKMAARGEMVAVISFKVAAATDMDIMAVGREVLGRLNEEYYGVIEGSVWEQLQSAVERVKDEVSDPEKVFGLVTAAGENGKEGKEIVVEQFDIAAGVLWGGIWYVVGRGGGGLWIFRNGEVGPILRGEEGDGSEWGGSGLVADGDVFLLGTKRFFDLVGSGVIKAALSSGSSDEAVGILSPVVRGKGESEGAAAAVAAVEKMPDLRPVSEVAAEPVADTVPVSGGNKKNRFSEMLAGLSQRIPRPTVPGFGRRGLGVLGGGLYIRTYRPPGIGRRGTMALGVFLLILILGSVIVGVRIQRDRELAAGPMAQAQQRLSQAKELADLSPDRAKQVLAEAKTIALTVRDEKQRAILLSQIGDLSDRLSGVKRVTPTVFMDLRLVRDGLSVQDSALDSNNWWGLDTNFGRLVKIDIASKQADVVGGKEQVGKAARVTASGDLAYVFNDQGVVEIDTKNSQTRVVAGNEKDWGKVVDISDFGGNIYLLDRDGGMIWRYPAIEGGFGGKQRWFRDGKMNLANAVGMAIDGSIWVATSDGLVLKFTQGATDSFTMPQLDQPIGNLAAIFTTADSDNLYLLDNALGRVVVVSKKGDYVDQYVADDLKKATNIAVDESGEKAILATAGDKVLEIKL